MATPKPELVEVTVTKETWETKTGIKFYISENGTVIISDITETSLFKDTELQVGHELISINGIPCAGCYPKDCADMIREVEGDVTIVAKELTPTVVAVTVMKETTATKTGIKFYVSEDGKTVTISDISDTSLFKNSALEVGYDVISINNVPCTGMKPKDVAGMVRDAVGPVTVLAQDPDTTLPGTPGAPMYVAATIVKESADSKTGIGFNVQNGSVFVSSISETSLFQETALKSGHEIVSVNNKSCQGMTTKEVAGMVRAAEGTVTIIAKKPPPKPTLAAKEEPAAAPVAARVVKESKASKTGVKFVKEEDGTVIVSDIGETSLFKSTPLKVGMQVLSVNGTECSDLSTKEVADIIRSAEGAVVIMAQEKPKKKKSKSAWKSFKKALT